MKILRQHRDLLRGTAEENEAADTELQRQLDRISLALVAPRRIPADGRIKELGDLAHAAVRFPSTRGPRAPVAVGRLPRRFVVFGYPLNPEGTGFIGYPLQYSSSKTRRTDGSAD